MNNLCLALIETSSTGATALSTTTLSITTASITIAMRETQHIFARHLLSLCWVFFYAECRVLCCYAECRGAF